MSVIVRSPSDGKTTESCLERHRDSLGMRMSWSWGIRGFQCTLLTLPSLLCRPGSEPCKLRLLPGLLETMWEKLCLAWALCPQLPPRKELRPAPFHCIYRHASPHGIPTPGPSQEVR